jgi:pSer/pThr/pTyr-binding forkhead associated (FHA) protein
VEDLGSTNGTYLNQRKVTAPTQISAGDRIRVGKTVLEVRR